MAERVKNPMQRLRLPQRYRFEFQHSGLKDPVSLWLRLRFSPLHGNLDTCVVPPPPQRASETVETCYPEASSLSRLVELMLHDSSCTSTFTYNTWL